MPMKAAKRSLLILIAVLLAAALTYVGYIELPSKQQATSSPEVKVSEIAPDDLLGMKKIVVSRGEDALQRVKQSHTGSIEHIKDVAIVHYMNMKEDKFLTLWTTLYQNETIANTEKQVYQTSSDGVSHYFWTDQEWVFYIIPHNFTQDEVAEVIDAIPGEVTRKGSYSNNLVEQSQPKSDKSFKVRSVLFTYISLRIAFFSSLLRSIVPLIFLSTSIPFPLPISLSIKSLSDSSPFSTRSFSYTSSRIVIVFTMFTFITSNRLKKFHY